MSIKKVIEFTDFNWFYAKYKPLTPYGIDHKENYNFITDKIELESIHSSTLAMIELINKDEHTVVKVEHHLSKIDRLNAFDKTSFDLTDLFLIKKLLVHYKAITSYLDNKWPSQTNIINRVQILLDTLSPKKDFNESFYLSSAFDDGLKALRIKIDSLNTELSNIRQQTIDELIDLYQLDFNHREFILVETSKIDQLNANHLIKEFYDSNLLRIKPIYPNEYTMGLIEKEELLNQEAACEKKVLDRLSEAILEEEKHLKSCLKTIEELDICIAKARLALKYSLTKPELNHNTIEVNEGNYLPLKIKHEKAGLKYQPLTASFDSNSILLSGSNMGGKTILFKTLGFLQLLSQMGFFVPAIHFKTQVYHQINVLGVAQLQNIDGLSSYGQEIHNLSNALSQNGPMLLLVDELAKTTNATEAKAILYAVLKYVATHNNISGFFSTHFINIPPISGVLKYRMRGLDKQAYLSFCEQHNGHDIKEKIKLINSFMQYEVEKDEGKPHQFDALLIADLLGLDSEIMNYANEFLDTKYD